MISVGLTVLLNLVLLQYGLVNGCADPLGKVKEEPPTFVAKKEPAHAAKDTPRRPHATPGRALSLDALARVLRPEIVREILDECGAREQRSRKLPAATVVLLCVAMNLYATDCLLHVFFRLVSRLPFVRLSGGVGAWVIRPEARRGRVGPRRGRGCARRPGWLRPRQGRG